MHETPQEQLPWKGIEFWKDEMSKAGVLSKLKFFNDIIAEKNPPHPESGYGTPVMTDVILDGKKTDVYHTDKNKNDTLHRLFLHIKE